MNLEESVKLAFLKMVCEVIKADGKVHPGELEILEQLKTSIGFDEAFLHKAKQLEYDEALVTLYKLPHEDKKALTGILDEVALSDGFIHKKEMDLIIDTLINMGMGEESE